MKERDASSTVRRGAADVFSTQLRTRCQPSRKKLPLWELSHALELVDGRHVYGYLPKEVKAQVDEIRYVPAALALNQRPGVPGMRSTFGTMTELNNSLRLLFSRCAHHVCPHCGARVEPSLNVAAGLSLTCPTCGREFYAPSAEDLAFNSGGACPTCGETGIKREVDEASLVPDESTTINEGAVLPWGTLMWDLMKQVAGEMGVRTDVPFNQLTPQERDIVFHGPAVKKHILYVPKNGEGATPLDFTYYNAVYTVEDALA